jgi:hypothetical protein
MTSILIVDSQASTRLKLQFELLHSGQFERVLACDSLANAEKELSNLSVQVMLLASNLALEQQDWANLAAHHPDLSLVMVHENSASLNSETVAPVHAHMQCTGSVMDWVASIAKALVLRAKVEGCRTGVFRASASKSIKHSS